jgi:adaptin ear-binding coat-associated protein 1/2
MAEEEASYERTLLQLPRLHVFKIPIRSSAAGHRAADWPKEPAWTGKLKITARGSIATIYLLDSNTNQIFAVCPVTDDAAVEKTLDSGRYFVLRIQNAQGRHAFIGIAFNERNDAFDFNVALAEHKTSCEREVRASKYSADEDISGPMRDLRLKEGEKITVKLAGTSTVRFSVLHDINILLFVDDELTDVSFLITSSNKAPSRRPQIDFF